MSRPQNRSQLMKYLGAVQKNTVWAWCGVNHEERKVYFSIWTHHSVKHSEGRSTYILQEPHWGMKTGNASAARKDQDEKFRLVFELGYESFGYFNEAKDKNAQPAEIEHTKTSFIVGLEIERLSNGAIIGHITQRIDIRYRRRAA